MTALRNLGIAALTALAVTGCGGDENGVPRGESDALRNALRQVKRDLEPLDCDQLSDVSVPAVEAQVQNLPDDVDADVRETIEDGVAELRNLVAQECAEANEPETDTQPETTPAPTPEPAPPPPPETTPEPPPEEPPPDEPDEEQPGEGNGNGTGNGGASGPGGGSNKRGKDKSQKGDE
jgi:outer membrane biosynthesis protein TonB